MVENPIASTPTPVAQQIASAFGVSIDNIRLLRYITTDELKKKTDELQQQQQQIDLATVLIWRDYMEGIKNPSSQSTVPSLSASSRYSDEEPKIVKDRLGVSCSADDLNQLCYRVSDDLQSPPDDVRVDKDLLYSVRDNVNDVNDVDDVDNVNDVNDVDDVDDVNDVDDVSDVHDVDPVHDVVDDVHNDGINAGSKEGIFKVGSVRDCIDVDASPLPVLTNPEFAVCDDPIVHTVYQNDWYRICSFYFGTDISIQLFQWMDSLQFRPVSRVHWRWLRTDETAKSECIRQIEKFITDGKLCQCYSDFDYSYLYRSNYYAVQGRKRII